MSAGTRVPVDTLFDYLEVGKSLDEFLEQFPTVCRSVAARPGRDSRSPFDLACQSRGDSYGCFRSHPAGSKRWGDVRLIWIGPLKPCVSVDERGHVRILDRSSRRRHVGRPQESVRACRARTPGPMAIPVSGGMQRRIGRHATAEARAACDGRLRAACNGGSGGMQPRRRLLVRPSLPSCRHRST